MTLQLEVNFIFPPIPIRNFDWSVTAAGYEPGMIIGYGRTIAQALDNYVEQHEDEFGDMPKYNWK